MGHKTTKKPTVKEVPPSPEPSSDEVDSAVDSSDDEQLSPKPSQHHIAPSKKPSSTKITKLPSPSPDPQSGSDDDEQSDDDDEVEETRTRTPSPPPQPKPTTKPTPKPTSSKRPADSQPIVAALPEKKHKQDKDKPSPSSPANSKGMFEKIWSADDEAVILNGMLEFRTSKGYFGTANHGEVLDSIRDSLSVPDFKKVQLTNKIRRLRDRYFRLKSGKKSAVGPNDGLVLKVGDLLWRDSDKSSHPGNDNANGNSTKRDKKGKDKGKGVVGEAIGVAKEEIVEQEKAKEVRKEGSTNGEVGREGETDSDDEVEFDVEYVRTNNKMIKQAMKKMSEEERNEVNEKLRKANAGFKAAYSLKLEVLLMAFNKYVG